MNKDERRFELVRYWWSKAEESLESAKREYQAGSYNFTMNRLYYASFYGVCAALFERGLSFRKHSGVRSAFHKEFIKTKQLDVNYGKLYDQLFEDRQEGDYIAFVTFEADYVEHQMKNCVLFLEKLKPFVTLVFEKDV